MYQVLCDGYPLLDWRDNDLILVNPKVKLAVNKVGEASFTLYKNHPHYDKLKRSRSVFEISDEIGVIFRGRMTGDTIDFDNGKAVDLEGAMAYFNDSVVRPYTFPNDFLEDPEYIAASKSGNVIRFWLNWLINNHNEQVQEFQRFKLGNVTVTDPNNYLYRYSKKYANTWETLQADLFKSALGGYLCIRYEADGNYIDYLSKFDQTNTQEIVFGENLMDLKNETDSSATYSAIIPLGADSERTVSAGTVEGEYVDFELTKTVKGQLDISGLPDGNVTEDIVKKGDTLYSVSAVNQIGWIYAPTSETTWDDVEKAESLLTKGIDWFAANGMMSSNTIEVTAVDLHFSDAEISSFRMYRNINVRSAPHDIVSTYPLAELDIDLLNPQSTKITVGESRLTLIDKQYSENTNAADKIVDLNNQGTMIGIANVKTLYYLSTSGEELTGGEWVTEEPTRTDGTYIWTKSVILYTDKSTYESPPSCSTGAKGDKGDPGIGVDVVLLEYYLSDSSTTQSGGEWVATAPTWSEGKYLWTRGVIYYTDGSKSYTSPVCDSTWDAVTDLDNKLNQEEVFNRLTRNGSLQGLYMENGNMYFNGSYIKSGEILADLIKAGVIKSKDGESIVIDLDNGTLNAVGTLRTLMGEGISQVRCASEMNNQGFKIGIDNNGSTLESTHLVQNELLLSDNRGNKAKIYLPYSTGETTSFNLEQWSKMGTSYIRLETLSDYDSLQNMAVIQMRSAVGQNSLAIMVSPDGAAIHGLTPPTGDSDAVNKQYVDGNFAPAGYGLGGEAKKLTSADNLNNVWQSGNYWWDSHVPVNAPVFDSYTNGMFSFMRVDGLGDGTFTQTVWSYFPDIAGQCMTRYCTGEWEWVNPPMIPGVEYRTTERWSGYPVYRKLIQYTNDTAFAGTALYTIPHGVTGAVGKVGMEIKARAEAYQLPYVASGESTAVNGYNATVIELMTAGNTNWPAGMTWNFELKYAKPE